MTHQPLDFRSLPKAASIAFAAGHADSLERRRTVRSFSSDPVPEAVILDCLRAACAAPSGANRQPWHFAVVKDPDKKRAIRIAAEKEETAFYRERASKEWLEALAPLGTDANKPFLEQAPYLIAIFQQRFQLDSHGNRQKNYYAPESVGIATGILISALHQAGVVCLTHTPSPMGFLQNLLARPSFERPYLLLVVGYPALDATVPVITRKAIDEVVSVF
jgi:nitroreductase